MWFHLEVVAAVVVVVDPGELVVLCICMKEGLRGDVVVRADTTATIIIIDTAARRANHVVVVVVVVGMIEFDDKRRLILLLQAYG